VETAVTDAEKPDLALGLITMRDASERPAEEGAGIVPHAAEVTATIKNLGDAVAGETTTRFWVRGAISTGNCGSSTPPDYCPATRSRSRLSGTYVTAKAHTRSL
jgi:hypothetical protein